MGAADVGPGIRLLQQAHIPHYILPEWACEAMAYVQRIRQWRQQPMAEFEPLPVDRQAARAIIEDGDGGYLDEDRALAVLEAYGMPVPKYKLCKTADEAAAFAETDRLSGGAARGQPANHSQVGGAGHRVEPGRRPGGPRRRSSGCSGAWRRPCRRRKSAACWSAA